MAVANSELDKVKQADGDTASFKAILDALVVDHTITADIAGVIKLALDHNRGKFDPAIKARPGGQAVGGPPYATGGGMGAPLSAPGTLYANPGGTGGGPGPQASIAGQAGTAVLPAAPLTDEQADKLAERVAEKLRQKPGAVTPDPLKK